MSEHLIYTDNIRDVTERDSSALYAAFFRTLMSECETVAGTGMFTAGASTLLAQKGYLITVVTPAGLNVTEILRVMKTLAPQFEQVVLARYPPLIRDVLDAGAAEGIDWAGHATKMIFAGEVFSEA